MKGCPVTLVHIVMADDEDLPSDLVAGQPHSLRFMPTTLILRAEGVPWKLPEIYLPSGIPSDIDRRGLFQLRPAFDYLRVPVADDYISVRRTSFLLTPADTMTVWAAQGSTFDAVVVDRKCHLAWTLSRIGLLVTSCFRARVP